MKNLRLSKVSKYFLYTLLVVVFTNCQNSKTQKAKFYIYDAKIEVKYMDNTKDTIFSSFETGADYKPKYKLIVSEPTFFGEEKIVPCLRVSNGFRSENLAANVKNFRILKETKIPSR